MGAFQLFDPYAFLSEGAGTGPASPEALGGLAALAGLAPTEERACNLAQAFTSPTHTALAAFATLADPIPDAAAQCHEAPLRAWAAKPAKSAREHKWSSFAQPAAPKEAPRAWVEGVAQLDAERPPVDVPPRRWRQFIYDAARFLDGGFAAQAAALDWDALDLFGCDQIRPFARIDNAGLVWLLNGDRLVALTERSARIEAQSGATLTYYRKPGETGRVLAWQAAQLGERRL